MRTLLLSAFSFISVWSSGAASPPKTDSQPVQDTYHGVVVSDPYRWLENADEPGVRSWTRQQNEYARSVLDAVPDRLVIAEKLKAMMAAEAPSYFELEPVGEALFALKRQPPLEQPILVELASARDLHTERTVLDPNTLGAHTSIVLYKPSPDGKSVAICLTQGGSEEGNLYLYDVKTGRRLDDKIPRVVYATAGGCIEWLPDSSGFYYTRYPRAGERPAEDLNFYQQIYFHRVGTDEKADRYVMGREFPKIGEASARIGPDGTTVLITVQNGDGGDFAHWLIGSTGVARQLTRFEDGAKAIVFGKTGDLYIFSRKGAPRGKILRLRAGQHDLAKAETIVPEGESVITGWGWYGLKILPSFHVLDETLVVEEIVGGPSQVRFYTLDGKPKGMLPLLPVSAVGGIAVIGGSELLFNNVSYTEPPGWYHYKIGSPEKPAPTPLSQKAPYKFDDAEAIREVALSKDGTKVPLTIIRPKGAKLNGQNPLLLTGYGGYGVTLSPGFLSARDRLWLDRGGIIAVANLRGGGEFGEAWHKSGHLIQKQNVFDDFIACAEHLIQRGYTSRSKLAIEGASNGGLLMGAVLTQRPDLFNAVIIHVGILDALRAELEPNGAFNVPEFGTVQDAAQFKALLAYSPYHNVKTNTPYPAVLITTGENDKRVNPANSFKMTARLQAATSSKRPIILRTSTAAGHGFGTALSERIAQSADALAFLLKGLEMQ